MKYKSTISIYKRKCFIVIQDCEINKWIFADGDVDIPVLSRNYLEYFDTILECQKWIFSTLFQNFK